MSKVKVIQWTWSKVTQIQNFIYFFFRNRLADLRQFHVYPLWDEGTKVWSYGLGHMTNMAAMSIYDKNP